MAYRPRPLPLLAAVLACAVIGVALPAAASGQVSCGAVITSDVTLDSDLACPPIEPITIGADRVTFDLNGHVIIGLVVVDSSDRVTVRDGFMVLGLHLVNAHRNRLLNVGVGEGGLQLVDSNRNLIQGSTAGGIGGGIGLSRSNRNVIRDSVMGGVQSGGLGLDEGSDRNVISGNNVSGDIAIGIGGSRNIIVGNTAVGLSPVGSERPGEGIFVSGGQRNGLERNAVRGTTDGILVAAAANRTQVADNTANGSRDDGIDIDSAATTLRGNTANDNGDLGIEAVPGVRDAGGNRASGNGNPLQCLNVFCR